MKILHLSIYDRKGGACIAAYRQHQAMVAAGMDSSMWVRQKFTDDPRVFEFRPSSQQLPRAKRLLNRYRLRHERRKAGHQGELFDDRSEHGGMELAGIPEHDLINVQFSQDFLDLPAFYQWTPPEIPIVVTLHEMSMFTGGCSYAYDCRRFEQNCGQCPQLRNSGAGDASAKSWQRKHSAYANRPKGKLHFVADSHWLAREAKDSGLLRDYPISVIHYGIDTDIFSPRPKSAARELLGLPQDRPVIAFSAASVTDERKGVGLLAEAIRQLPQAPFLLTWGGSFPSALAGLPHLHLRAIDSEHLVSIAYNACDFFVIPSLEEAFGQTCLEAMACGRPVIGFDVGGIPDMTQHEQTGLLVPKGDVPALAQAIQRLSNAPQHTETMGHVARQMVMDHFTFAHNAEAYRALYAQMLNVEC
jgi:glycosyltransferase involved in cell wall biosynthesis